MIDKICGRPLKIGDREQIEKLHELRVAAERVAELESKKEAGETN